MQRAGDMVAIMEVFVRPPRESCSSLVNLLSLLKKNKYSLWHIQQHLSKIEFFNKEICGTHSKPCKNLWIEPCDISAYTCSLKNLKLRCVYLHTVQFHTDSQAKRNYIYTVYTVKCKIVKHKIHIPLSWALQIHLMFLNG